MDLLIFFSMDKLFVSFVFIVAFLSCNSEMKNKIVNENLDKTNIDKNETQLISNLPNEVDSINISFSTDRFNSYLLHITKDDYILRDFQTKESFNVNFIKDSLSKYIYDIFIYEKVNPIVKTSNSNYILSENYHSLTVSKYFNDKTIKSYDMSVKDISVNVEFSNEYNKLNRFLLFMGKSPKNIKERLNTIQRFNNRKNDKR